jgi:hypothetical protein
MARIIYDGQRLEVPGQEVYGQDLKDTLKVGPERNLVLLQPEGNVQVNPRRRIRLAEENYFVDVPTWKYGAGTRP